MLTNANKGTYLVQKWPKIANVIYERPLAKSHGSQVGGNLKLEKTANRLLELVWWVGLWAGCAFFITECPICKRMKAKEKTSNTYLRPLPQCTFPFQTISLDLKGP